MSKYKMNIKEKILEKALEMFNERGIEYVGLRELAAMLDIRVGNITYYFPTKDDLVYELSLELKKHNAEIMTDNETITMEGFLNMLYNVFENHYRFRCLLRSFVHVMTQNKLVAASYSKIRHTRRATIASNIHKLFEAGYLKSVNEADIGYLVSTIEMLSRYWVSDAAVFMRTLGKEKQIQHYLFIIINLFLPYSSAKCRKEIVNFRERLCA